MLCVLGVSDLMFMTRSVAGIYGGSLQFVFGEDGSAQMVQGNGTAVGTYEYVDTGVSMVAMRDGNGTNGIYFVQE